MPLSSLPRSRNEFHVGIICALSLEAEFVESVLDKCWESEGTRYGKAAGDQNAYTTGLIRGHNVVLAHMPGMGSSSAAAVAAGLRSSFPQIKLALVVGICGATPIHTVTNEEIMLGDCIISTAVIQYDFGRQYPGGFSRKNSIEDSLGKASPEIRALTQKLTTPLNQKRVSKQLGYYLTALQSGAPKAKYPGVSRDRLYESSYIHGHKSLNETCLKDIGTCSKDCDELKCDLDHLSTRKRFHTKETFNSSEALENLLPAIHFGRFGSANTVMKSGTDRDRIAKADKIIAFEMEGAGVWDQFPTVVIKAVCDYADSHKNKEWQIYAAASAAACMKAFLDEWVIPDQVPSKSLKVLPFGRNKDFVGRHAQLKQLITILHTEDTEEDCQRVALVGLGGVGKTQIALECAFQLQKILPVLSVFWVRANDVTSFDNAFRDIGQQLEIPGLEDEKVDVKRLVKTKLSQESTGKWLVIIDNADDFEIFYHYDNQDSGSVGLSEYLPFSTFGAILFTTRDRDAATRYAGSNVIDIGEMDDKESRQLLQRSLQNKQLISDDSGTTKLLDLLVNLPLAIIQAAAYLNANGSTIAEYLSVWKESSDNVIKLLSKNFEDTRRYPAMKNPVATTWLISFQHIQVRDPLAADYMAFMSCIKEQDIPRDLLPPASEFKKTEALGTLKAFGFIKQRVHRESYDMHRLVHTVMQNWLKLKDDWRSCNQRTLEQIENVFPWPQHENRAMWMMYLPHAQCIVSTFNLGLSRTKETEELLWRLLYSMGCCSQIKGHYADAEAIYRQMLQETVLGKDHPDTLVRMNNLAISLCQQGKHIEAEAIYQQTLQLRETVLGKDHPDTLRSMNNLAESLRQQGKYIEAEAILRQTLQLKEIVLGKDHPDTLRSMNNLVISLHQQGKYAEAEAIRRR